MTRYIVTIASKYAPASEQPSNYEIEAPTKREAIARARKLAGWQSRHDGPMIYTALAPDLHRLRRTETGNR